MSVVKRFNQRINFKMVNKTHYLKTTVLRHKVQKIYLKTTINGVLQGNTIYSLPQILHPQIIPI